MAQTADPARAIAALTPLKILIVAEKEATLTEDVGRSFVTAIQRAFQGGLTEAPDGSEKYYSVGDELGVEVQTLHWVPKKNPNLDSPAPSIAEGARTVADAATAAFDNRVEERLTAERLLASCGHLFVVALLKDAPAAEGKFGQWLDRVATDALRPDHENRIGLLPVALDTQSEDVRLGQFNEFQRLPVSDLGEHALRAGYLGLLVLQRAWSLLTKDADGRMKLFISHAKKDGAAIALAMKAQILSLRWLQPFYDACDILPGAPWRRVLRNGVRDSAIVVLRTDIYEQRPWCVQEIQWAEEFGCPSVVVDLRAASTMPRESLPVAGMVTVTIYDGNLIRILNAALREAMRVRLFRRTIELLEKAGVVDQRKVVTVPRPSISTMGLVFERFLQDPPQNGCDEQGKKRTITPDEVEWVVTPEPFRESLRAPAERLVAAYFKNAKLVNPRDITF
ncbi:MAG: toll/interleukin-1 receptor domain-containing protein [Planctomycetaceae bacterium]|nr:toll/interleukin-1 receptor domain-containing protein [Planctomycetaceae bacterium]